MSSENVELVRRSLEVWNAGDIDRFASEFSRPDTEWVIAKEHPDARTLRGAQEIAAYLRDWQRTVQGLRFDATEYVDAGETVLSTGTIYGRAGEDGPEVRVPIAFVSRFEGGRVVRTEEYLDLRQAREAAGVPDGALPSRESG